MIFVFDLMLQIGMTMQQKREDKLRFEMSIIYILDRKAI